MTPESFIELLAKHNVTFFTGVPDSLLKYFCFYVNANIPPENHVICANEGGAVGVGVGHYLASQNAALVYMQNSGLGNALNPLLSIADKEVFSVPLLLMIGWRGEPGHADEPQHIKQGRITLDLVESMEIPFDILDADFDTTSKVIKNAVSYIKRDKGPYALIVKKDSFDKYVSIDPKIPIFSLKREDAIQYIIDSLDMRDIVIATTGMASREVFEYRKKLDQGHIRDFLTVGGMGHASQIALGIALQKKGRKVFCLDGDGAVLMHMGSMAINANQNCTNFYHILINNGAHDSVGGQPTVGFDISFQQIAEASRYKTVLKAVTEQEVLECLAVLKSSIGPAFLEICVQKGYRKDLGRPTTTPVDNKNAFMDFLIA
jgi:phosphonopyruvate decarboxylase